MLLRCESLEPPMSQLGSNPVIAVMSATRPLFLRKQTFVPDLAMSRKCQYPVGAGEQAALRARGPS